MAATFTSGFKGEATTVPGVVDEELSTPRSGTVFVLVPTGSGDSVVGVNIVAVAMELLESVLTAVAAIFVVTGSIMATTVKKSKL